MALVVFRRGLLGLFPIIERLAITFFQSSSLKYFPIIKCIATDCMLSGQPNHGWQLCFPFWLRAGGSDFRLCDGSDLGTCLLMVGAWCFGCSCPPVFACWVSFAPVFGFVCFWVLIFALSPCYILIYMFCEMMH